MVITSTMRVAIETGENTQEEETMNHNNINIKPEVLKEVERLFSTFISILAIFYLVSLPLYHKNNPKISHGPINHQ